MTCYSLPEEIQNSGVSVVYHPVSYSWIGYHCGCRSIRVNALIGSLTYPDKFTPSHRTHRSNSIQGTDYIATLIQGFLGQKLKI